MKKFKELSGGRKAVRIILTSLVSLLLLVILVVGSYLAYVSIQYYRIEDNTDLTSDIHQKSSKHIDTSDSFSLMTFNIGFGAYDKDYDFFMDYGVMKDGTVIQGTHSRAISYERALANTNGCLSYATDKNPDFLIVQEMDKDSDRCYHINQYEIFEKAFPAYSNIYASYFHSAYLAYPFNEPIGKIECGLVTYSKYAIDACVRRSYPVDTSFPNKFFDLDRGFSVSRFNLSNGKEFVLCNSHMSAYDEGGVIRKQQLEFLCTFLEEEYSKGNYVIVGGDFNHDIANSCGLFPSEELLPDWVAAFDEKELPSGYSIAASVNCSTCRAAEMPYTKGVNYEVVIDGFIVSDNISVDLIYNIDGGYL
nr:endonuclease [Gammaproteobacteria bacterium]